MYFRYLSKLTFDQLLYTNTDSVIMYRDFNRADHVMLLTPDLLGDLKDEYDFMTVRILVNKLDN